MTFDLADAVAENIAGQQDAARFLDRLGREFAGADELFRQILLAHAAGPDRLRGFARALQKEIERGGDGHA